MADFKAMMQQKIELKKAELRMKMLERIAHKKVDYPNVKIITKPIIDVSKYIDNGMTKLKFSLINIYHIEELTQVPVKNNFGFDIDSQQGI